jgi:hypothetical protein
MELKDYLSITISVIALVFSIYAIWVHRPRTAMSVRFANIKLGKKKILFDTIITNGQPPLSGPGVMLVDSRSLL